MLGRLFCHVLTAALVASLLMIVPGSPHSAHAATGSHCVAMADAGPPVRDIANARLRPSPVAFVPVSLEPGQVRITYITHSTFRIETAGGVVIATDYAGFAGKGRLPDAVTMNHAHDSHYTDFPAAGILHVLRGWNPAGGPARHRVTIGDALIRNVPTDIRSWDGGREPYGNSIFVFEVAGLCIGHLGHLHHELAAEDLGQIGQLDIVMAPVDGTFTLDQLSMARVLKLLKARLVIPMHAFGVTTLASFVKTMGASFAVDYSEGSTVVVSTGTLPKSPTILVMPETTMWSFE